MSIQKFPSYRRENWGHQEFNNLPRSLAGGVPMVFPDKCPSAILQGVKKKKPPQPTLFPTFQDPLLPSLVARRSYRSLGMTQVKDGRGCVGTSPSSQWGLLPCRWLVRAELPPGPVRTSLRNLLSLHALSVPCFPSNGSPELIPQTPLPKTYSQSYSSRVTVSYSGGTHMCTHTYTYNACICIYAHTQTQAHMHTHIHTCTYAHTYLPACTDIHIQNTYTYMYTHTQLYTCTHKTERMRRWAVREWGEKGGKEGETFKVTI